MDTSPCVGKPRCQLLLGLGDDPDEGPLMKGVLVDPEALGGLAL